MSSTFSPIKLDKELTKTGVKTVVLALLNAPAGAFMGVLTMVFIWFLLAMNASLGKVELGAASVIVLTVMFVLGQVYLPALFGSYLMYRYTYKQRWLDFWRNIKGSGFVRLMMHDLLFYVFIFTFMHFFFEFIMPGKPAGSEAITKNAAHAIVSLLFVTILIVIAVYYWLNMSTWISVALRTGFSQSGSRKYQAQAKRLNPKLTTFSSMIIVLMFLVIMLSSLPVFLMFMAFSLVQILVSMFWVYVLFGNTFPKKMKKSMSATSKLRSSVV